MSGLAPAQAEGAAAGEAEIWSSDYWANKGGVKLNLWRKRVGAPKPGEKPLPILFLVHGSSNSTRSSYDLSVPGKGEYSLMNVMAREGYRRLDHGPRRLWPLRLVRQQLRHRQRRRGPEGRDAGDHEGNGPDRRCTCTARRRAASVQQPSRKRSLRDVDRLILSAFTYKGDGAAEIARRRARIDELRANPRRKRDAAMIRSIFTRDGHPGAVDPAVPEAIIAVEMKFGDTIPTGTYLDMAANLPIVDPKKVLSPVLMLRGIWDGNSTDADLLEFYTQLPNGDRQFVILPETAHSPGYGKNRHLLWYAIKNFLAAPAPIAAS